MKKSARSSALGFTLVELLVVIAIIAILAAVVVLIINPIELTKRSRDAVRLTDLANLQQAINVAAQEATSSGTEILCVGGLNSGTLCTGTSTDAGANVRKSDGTGWVKVDLSSQRSVSIPTLPIDPSNNTENFYSYASDGNAWEISAHFESTQYADKMKNDGGNNDELFEVGSSLTLMN